MNEWRKQWRRWWREDGKGENKEKGKKMFEGGRMKEIKDKIGKEKNRPRKKSWKQRSFLPISVPFFLPFRQYYSLPFNLSVSPATCWINHACLPRLTGKLFSQMNSSFSLHAFTYLFFNGPRPLQQWGRWHIPWMAIYPMGHWTRGLDGIWEGWWVESTTFLRGAHWGKKGMRTFYKSSREFKRYFFISPCLSPTSL